MRVLPLIGLALAAVAAPAFASTIADPVGDIYPAFAANPVFGGGTVPGGFDVTSFTVARDPSNFLISATLAGSPTGIGDGIYVFGVNRGAGTSLFAPNVLGVKFDSVVVLDPVVAGGSPTLTAVIIGGATTPLSTASLVLGGNSLSFSVPLSALPSTGFSFDRYGFNLWPRLPGGPFTNIADFAPDNATIAAVPEPATWAAMMCGFGLLGGTVRQRRRIPAMA